MVSLPPFSSVGREASLYTASFNITEAGSATAVVITLSYNYTFAARPRSRSLVLLRSRMCVESVTAGR